VIATRQHCSQNNSNHITSAYRDILHYI